MSCTFLQTYKNIVTVACSAGRDDRAVYLSFKTKAEKPTSLCLTYMK